MIYFKATTTATTTMAITTSTTPRPDTTRPLPTTAATATIVTSTTPRLDTNGPLPTTTAPMSLTKSTISPLETMETIGTSSTTPDNGQMAQGLVIGKYIDKILSYFEGNVIYSRLVYISKTTKDLALFSQS